MLIDKFTGIRNDIPSERFELSDLTGAQNVIIDDSQRIDTRPGMTLLAAGARHSLWSNGDRAFLVQGDTLYELATDLTTAAMRTNLTLNAPMSYAVVGDRVYFANGFERGVIDSGAARSWGAPIPALPEARAVTGSLDPGRYQYALTHLMADAQESGSVAPGLIDVTQGGIDFTLPALSTEAQAFVLYLSTADGRVLYEAQILTGASTTITAHDDVVPMETMNLCGPLDNTHLVAEYLGHLIIGAGQFLMHSQSYGPELFDQRDYFVFDSQLTMIAPTDNGVFVGTQDSVSFLSGRAPEEFTLSQLTDYGVIPGSLVAVQARLLGFEGVGEGMAALWLTNKGICVGFPGGTFYNLSDPRYQLSGAGSRAAALLHSVNGSTYYTASI